MKTISAFILMLVAGHLAAQDYRPGLLFREDFKETPPEIPVSQTHIANPDVLFSTYGPARDSLKKSNHEKPIDDPFYMWSGLCLDTWVATFKHKEFFADLSSFAKIKWRTKQAGFHQLRIVLKLADGSWLVSQQFDGPSKDWRIREFIVSDLQWYSLNIEKVKELRPMSTDEIDLTKVDEIGCTDLMKGGSSNACSRLDWIEVYANPVKR